MSPTNFDHLPDGKPKPEEKPTEEPASEQINDAINVSTNLPEEPGIVFLKVFSDNNSLSVQQQTYYLSLIGGIFGHDEEERNSNLELLSSDHNVKPFLPDLTTFIKETIRLNIAHPDLTLLIYAVRVVRSLLSNQHLNLMKYLHDLLPVVLSCILARRTSKDYYDNHWTLRDFAGFLVASICLKYNTPINNITNRVIAVYDKPLKGCDTYPLTSIYGAIKGIAALGEETVKNVLFPRIFCIGKLLYVFLETHAPSFYIEEENTHLLVEAKYVRDAVLAVAAPVLLKTKNVNDGGASYSQYFGYLGMPLYQEIKKLENIELENQRIIQMAALASNSL